MMREGEDLIENKPLDEFAHAKWSDRVQKYLNRKLPEIEIPAPWKLMGVPPNPLSNDRQQKDPIDSKLARTENGKQEMRHMMVFLARGIERLEFYLETEDRDRT